MAGRGSEPPLFSTEWRFVSVRAPARSVELMERTPPIRRASAIEGFFPGYFALVMATGIVSLASLFLEIPYVPHALFFLNLVFYAVLWIITLARFFSYRSALLFDLTHHANGVSFLTMV